MAVKKYGPVKKTIVVFLQIAFMVTFVISLYIFMYTFDKSIFSEDATEEVDYFSTEYFREDATKEIKRLLYYIQLRNNFETGRIFDTGKVVDIKDYIENDLISGESRNGLAYVMADLIEWGKQGIQTATFTIYDNTGTAYTIKDGLVDNFAPASDITLEEMFKEGYLGTIDDFNMMQDYLIRTIKALPQDINKYKEETTRFKGLNSNIKYTVVCGGTLYTNMDFKNITTTDADLRKEIYNDGTGVYLCINSANLVFESSFSNIESEMYRYIDSLKSFDNKDYAIYISIDKSLSRDDSLKESFNRYQQLRPWFMTSVITGIVSLIGLIISVAYLTMVAGYKDSRKTISLNFFDRIYTEVAAGVLILLAILILYEDYVFFRGRDAFTDTAYNVVILGLSTMSLDMLGLTGYLSLIRRIRAKSMWTNSILCVVTTPVKTALGSRAITVRVLIRYVLSTAVFLGLGYMSFYRREPVFLVLLAIAIIYCGTVLIRESFLKKRVIDGAAKIAEGQLDYKIDTNGLKDDNLLIAEIINEAGDRINKSVDEKIKSEKLKADLITNVSHDIKTPLTSIINYVDLLKREDIEDEKIKGYIQVLEEKSQRLKHLTEDLVEASKISSGNIEINLSEINLKELIFQTEGEFADKFEARSLTLNTNLPEGPVFIMADGMRIWRVIENLYNNVAKYALPNTRVYVNLVETETMAQLSIKNISAQALNIDANELTERFIRGDISRSTEGSGLGLSIAQNLTRLQGGTFDIYLDGDLFKITVSFPLVKREDEGI